MKTLVFSRTLRQSDYPNVTIVSDNQRDVLTALKAAPGKDIWLFGGGALFRSLIEEGIVDTVEVAVIPILLCAGVPLMPGPAGRFKLSLDGHKVYKSGIVSLEYLISPG